MVVFFVAVFYGCLVALLFSLAIFIHEFGHFLAARWLGLKVDAFSIGFGPALWKKTVDGIEYKICCIPFGGYVALPQLDPSGMQRIQGDHSDGEKKETTQPEKNGACDLPDIAAWKRILVAFAGPLGNVVLAVCLAYVLFFVPQAHIGVTDTRVGMVETNSPAYTAGLRTGDRIVSVNGTQVETWSDLRIESMLSGDKPSALYEVTKPSGTMMKLELSLSTNNVLGVKTLDGVYPVTKCVVTSVVPSSAAAKAGLLPGDEIVRMNRVQVAGATHFFLRMLDNGPTPVELTVMRGKKQMAFSLVPTLLKEQNRYIIGVGLDDRAEKVQSWMMYRSPWKQLKWDSLSVVRVLQAFVAPKAKGERKAVAEQIGGPVTIVVGLYRSVRGSIWDALGFLRMICMNLAILNLMPLPVLDGGHILFALYEIVARRKPHPKFVSVVTNAFAFLLIGLMLFLVYRDFVLQSKVARALRGVERVEAQPAAEKGK